MYIKKIKIYYKEKTPEYEFTNGANFIVTNGNQFGKTTILSSILYCVGARKEIFTGHISVPEAVELLISNDADDREIIKIYRNDNFIKVNDEIINDPISNIFDLVNKRIRFSNSSISNLLLWQAFYFMWMSQRKENVQNSSIMPSYLTAASKSDLNRIFAGFDVEKYLMLVDEYNKIIVKNRSIKKSMKIHDVLVAPSEIEDDIVETFNAAEKKLNDHQKELHKFFKENKDLRKIKNSFEEDVKYADSVKEYFSSIKKTFENTEISAWDILKDKINLTPGQSITEYRKACSNIELNELKISELKSKISDERTKIENISPEIRSWILKDTIQSLLVKPGEIIDLKKLGQDISTLKKSADEKIKNLEIKTLEILSKFDIDTSSAGIGDEFKKLIERILQQHNLNIPIIYDGFGESADVKNDDKMLDFLSGNLKGQMIIGLETSKHKLEIKPWMNVIILEKRIFD